jgi:hypothetical protein
MSTLQPLIAYYLAVSYPSALPSFLQATGLPPPDLSNPPNPDLRTLAHDYLSSQLAKSVQAVTIDDKATDGSWDRWTGRDIAGLQLKPEVRLEKARRNVEGISAANLLAVIVARVPKRRFDTSTAA